MVIRVEATNGYYTDVVNPLITDKHNSVNLPGIICLVRGSGDKYEGNAVCRIDEVAGMEVISE